MTIINFKSILVVLTFATQSCKTTAPIETKPFPIKNIAEHSFNLNIDKLKDTIFSFFTLENQDHNKYLNDIFFFYPSADMETEQYKMFIDFQAETNTTPLVGESYFTKPNTENDIYIHNFGTCWYSKLYYSNGKPLEYRTPFFIRFTKINETSTKVLIGAEDPKVLNGISGYGAHGAVARETTVEPSTIEEYSILLFIADKLGDKTLLPLKLPTNK